MPKSRSRKKRTNMEFDMAEHKRITEEVFKDRELQFRLFWQSITISAVIFSFCATILRYSFWLNLPFVILAPHIILIPTATIILNRARTANRKSGYLLATYDSFSNKINWERHLSILRQKSPQTIHRASTIKSMLLSITLLELLSIAVFLGILLVYPGPLENGLTTFTMSMLVSGGLYCTFYIYLLVHRCKKYFDTRYQDSIQGYATEWINVLNQTGKGKYNLGIDPWDSNTWKKEMRKEWSKGRFNLIWLFVGRPKLNEKNSLQLKKRWFVPILSTALVYAGLVILIIKYDLKISDGEEVPIPIKITNIEKAFIPPPDMPQQSPKPLTDKLP